MKVSLLTLGHKMPDWVNVAFQTYNNRLPNHLKLHIHELSAVARQKGLSVAQIKSKEAALLYQHLNPGNINIALDEGGQLVSTAQWAKHLKNWQMEGQDVNLMVGGADGLDHSIKQAAHQVWSLSALTFPHQLVKVIVAEQMYRAHSLLNNHPYHRE